MIIVLLICCDELRQKILKSIQIDFGNYKLIDLSHSKIDRLNYLLREIVVDYIFIDKISDTHLKCFVEMGVNDGTQIVQLENVGRSNNMTINALIYSLHQKQTNNKNLLSLKSISKPNINELVASYKKNHYKINLTDIYYFEKIGKNLHIRLESKMINVGRVTLKEVKGRLKSDMYAQCNKSLIVNISMISSIEHKDYGVIATFKDLTEYVYISENYKQQIVKLFIAQETSKDTIYLNKDKNRCE